MSILNNNQNFLSIFSNRHEINQVQCGDPIEPPISAHINNINNDDDLLFKSQSDQIRIDNINLNKFKNKKKKSSPNVIHHFLNNKNEQNYRSYNNDKNNKNNNNNVNLKKNKTISKINSVKKIQKNNSNISNNNLKNNNNNDNNSNNNNNNYNNNINYNNNSNYNKNNNYNNNNINNNNNTLKNTSNRTYSLIDSCSNNCDILSSKRTSNAFNSRRIPNNNNINVYNNFNAEKKQSSLNEIISPINNPKITNYNTNNMNNVLKNNNNNIDNNKKNNNNIIKKEIIKLSYSKFFSLLKYNSLFHLLKFLNNNDIKELLNINKHFRIYFNTILINVYYNKIINKLKKYKNFYEIIKKKIVFTKIKGKIKIDFQITIRFLMNLNHPLNMTILYAYNYKHQNNSINNNNNISSILNSSEINKSIISNNNSININSSINLNNNNNQIKNSKIVDFFSFDLFPSIENANNINENFLFPNIYMIREFTTFNLDNTLQKTYIQPILPFRQFDEGILSFQIYSPSKNFINPNSIQLTTKINSNYEKIISIKNSEINPRICQFEEHCVNLRSINLFKEKKSVIYQIKDIFCEYFKLMKILFEDIGFLVFKIYLKAIKVGELKDKKEIGINIKIREKDDFIINEIKKNDLLFEKRNVFECRIDDILIFYFTHDL